MAHSGSANYWSCVAYSASNAWNYNNNGMSNNNTLTNAWLRARPVTKLEILKIMEMEDLYKAYRLCRKHNRRSRDMATFEISLYGKLYLLCDAINSRNYSPKANYAFIHYRPRPREVFAAEPELKIIMAYIHSQFCSKIEDCLVPRVFNNRIGKGTQAAVNSVINDIYECSQGFTKDCWIIKCDLKGYFPNLNQDRAYELVSYLVGNDDEELLYLINVVCYCNPQDNCEKRSQLHEWSEIAPYKSLFTKPFGIGGAIGFLFWQIMSNYYLSDIDKWIIANITPRYSRFVDDMVMITSNKEMALIMLGELREKLANVGVEMHPKKFYCQHCAKGLEFLGYRIKRGRIYVNRKIVERAILSATKTYKPHYIERMNSYLGIIKSCDDKEAFNAVMRLVPSSRYIKDYTKWKINKRATS